MKTKMRHYFTVLLLLSLIWVANAFAVSLNRYDLADPEEVVTAYFQCLTEGDIASLTSLIGGNLFERKNQMLSNANHYSTFLKNYYKNSKLFSIVLNRIEDNKIQAVMVVLRQNSKDSFKLVLSKIGDQWIITDEITH